MLCPLLCTYELESPKYTKKRRQLLKFHEKFSIVSYSKQGNQPFPRNQRGFVIMKLVSLNMKSPQKAVIYNAM